MGDEGDFELVLPDGDAIPEALFRAAEAFIPVHAYVEGTECSLVVSDPEALVTFTIFEGITIASPIFLTAAGLGFDITATEATDLDEEIGFEDFTAVSLAYTTARPRSP